MYRSLQAQPSEHNHTYPNRSWAVYFHDRRGRIETVSSKNYDCVRPIASPDEFNNVGNKIINSYDGRKNTAFRISTPETSGKLEAWFGSPFIEYSCVDGLCPVPMVCVSFIFWTYS